MRRRKPVTVLAVVMAWLLFASTALAVVTIEGNNVFGNGHAITIDQDESGATRVNSSEDGAIDDNVRNADVAGHNIYGGSNGQDVSGNTSVTINGGEVGDVYGGGLNGDVNGSTTVTVNGGTTGDVYGGGHAEGGDANSSNRNGQNGDADVTGNTNTTVNGGATGDVYGGGHAEGGDAVSSGILAAFNGGNADATVGGSTNGGNTSVTVNGGSTGNVYGGGNAEGGDADERNGTLVIANGGDAAATVRNDTNVTINGGTVNGTV
ncbi:MAG TPA: hypothetical protein VN366_00235, partial [Feifaniaceae bacterium]|nr:hypothetical protein [Feifaniaceae bacterium]